MYGELSLARLVAGNCYALRLIAGAYVRKGLFFAVFLPLCLSINKPTYTTPAHGFLLGWIAQL